MSHSNGTTADQENLPQLPKVLKRKVPFMDELLEQRSKLRQNGDYTDLTILVGPNETEFKTHRAIVCTQSPYLKFACASQSKKVTSRTIRLRGLEPEVMEIIMKWMYEGVYELPERNNALVYQTFLDAGYLDLYSMRHRILETIQTHLSTQSVDCGIHEPLELVQMLHKSPWKGNKGDFGPVVHKLIGFLGPKEMVKEYSRNADNSFYAFLAMHHLRCMAAKFCGDCEDFFLQSYKSSSCCVCGKLIPQEE